MKTTVGIIVFASFITASAFAEARIWTDTKGNSIEAEYVLQTGDKVLLRQSDGKELKVLMSSLSKDDLTYIIRKSPPKLELDVNLDVDRSNSGNGRRVQVQTESMTAKVTIKKTRSTPYDAPLMSEIYLLGQRERSDDYIVMEQAKSEFNFAGAGRDEHVYTSGNVSSRQRDFGHEGGMDFKGYLVVVRDQEGTVIAMKASKPDFAEFAESIAGTKTGDTLDTDFEVVDAEETELQRRKRFL